MVLREVLDCDELNFASSVLNCLSCLSELRACGVNEQCERAAWVSCVRERRK